MRFALTSAAIWAFGVSVAAAQSGNPILALEECVVNQAKRMDISGESAEAIAVAAVANCGKELTAATPAGRNANEARMQLKDQMRETAIVTVVEARTLAKTPPPPPPAAEPPRRPTTTRRTTPARPATPRSATPAIPAP